VRKWFISNKLNLNFLAASFSEQGEDGLIFSDMEEAEEEMKTIPRQNTLQEFEANRQVKALSCSSDVKAE
jgi:hypothetical protein